VETLIIASHFLRKITCTDPYASPPSGLARLLTATGIIGLVAIGLQSAAGGNSSGFGLNQTAFASPIASPESHR